MLVTALALLVLCTVAHADGKPEITSHAVQVLERAVSINVQWQSENPVASVLFIAGQGMKEIKVDEYDNHRNPAGYFGEASAVIPIDPARYSSTVPYQIQLVDELKLKSELFSSQTKMPAVAMPGMVPFQGMGMAQPMPGMMLPGGAAMSSMPSGQHDDDWGKSNIRIGKGQGNDPGSGKSSDMIDNLQKVAEHFDTPPVMEAIRVNVLGPENVTFSSKANDDKGIRDITFRLYDNVGNKIGEQVFTNLGKKWEGSTQPIKVPTGGSYRVIAQAVDTAGNTSTEQVATFSMKGSQETYQQPPPIQPQNPSTQPPVVSPPPPAVEPPPPTVVSPLPPAVEPPPPVVVPPPPVVTPPPPPVVVPPPQPPPVYPLLNGMEDNTDRMGMDYRSFDLPTPDPKLCSSACEAEAQCKAYTFVRPGVQGPQARCWLKTTVPSPAKSTCCISGVKNQPLTGINPLSPPADPVIYTNGNIAGVQNGPTKTTTFSVDASYRVTFIYTYHYFNGGKLPGTISLKHSDGTTYGPWPAKGAVGQGGVPNAYWYVLPNVEIKAGGYTVIDSDTATWSQNSGSGGSGFVEVRGIKTGTPQPVYPLLSGMEDNTDRMGMDYRSFDLPAPDPRLCSSACEAESQCMAYTFVRPGVQGPQARCWLKTSVPGPAQSTCCISGVKMQSQPVSGSISGRWESSEGQITFSQTGNSITGLYSQDNGHITGTFTNSVLDGYWYEDSSSQRCSSPRTNGAGQATYYWGGVRFQFSLDTFAGTWGYCDSSVGHAWTGTRLK